MGKPPKLTDRTASPRHKTQKPQTTKAALRALQHLTDEQPTHSHFQDFITETNSEKNDRGAAILLATNVENALQGAILSMLRAQRTKELFGANSALGAFANKVQMAYAMDIFGDETKQNLDIIRVVRNAFAHAKIPIKFETPQVKVACSYLAIPKLLTPVVMRKAQDDIQGRQRYQEVCNATAHNLSVGSSYGYVRLPDAKDSLRIQLPENYEIYGKRRPLP